MTIAGERRVCAATEVPAADPSSRRTRHAGVARGRATPLSRRERIDNDLLRRYRTDNDLQARERLVERCMPLVRSVARCYAGRGQDPEDLTQAGLVGLTNAIERYNASRGGRFVSYAVPNIQGEIRKHFRDRTWAVHVPRAVQELDARLQRARTETLQKTGHEATVDDLALMLDVTTDEVEDAKAAGRNYRALSLDHPATEGAEPFAAHGAVVTSVEVVYLAE
jgi:RNA polymerase sigma-B factor